METNWTNFNLFQTYTNPAQTQTEAASADTILPIQFRQEILIGPEKKC
jgi:hypothetical protein